MSGVTLDVLVEAALTGRNYHQQRLGKEAERYARKITNHYCRDFQQADHEEVCQQALTELFARGGAALAGTTGLALFRRCVFLAIRIIRSDYAAPGTRTRRAATSALPEPRRIAAEDAGRIADPATLERCTVGEADQARLDLDLFESPTAFADLLQVEIEADLEETLGGAPPEVASALRLVCIRGETVSFAASSLGLSRFALTRRMDAFCPSWRLAA